MNALFRAGTDANVLIKHFGTDIFGLQLSDMNDNQMVEFVLFIKRVIVFQNQFRSKKTIQIGGVLTSKKDHWELNSDKSRHMRGFYR